MSLFQLELEMLFCILTAGLAGHRYTVAKVFGMPFCALLCGC